MKRIVCLLSAVFMILCLVSCDEANAGSDSENSGNGNVIAESKKNALCEEIVSEFVSAGYEIYDRELLPDEALAEARTEMEMPDLMSVEIAELVRDRQLGQYKSIMDVCYLSYITFTDETAAIVYYNEMLNEAFDARPTEESGEGYSRAVWRADVNEFGETQMLSRVGKVIVALAIEYDDYRDAELQYDNRPELILSGLGY